MGDDVLQDLYKLHKYASGLQGFLEEANRQASYDVEGVDASGAVVAVLGSDGLPKSFKVDYDWKRYLRPPEFGKAVVQAAQAAAAKRLEAWARAMSDADWEQKADQLRDRLDAERVTAPPPELSGPQRESGDVRPRDQAELTREMLAATSDLAALTAAPAAQGVGTTGYGKLEIVVSQAGLVSCTVDQFWVSDKSGEELNEALATALAAAREDLAAAVRATPVGRLGRLLDEALAQLRAAGT